MKLEHYFQRDETTFGLDAIPTDAAYLDLDNVFHAPQYGVYSEPIASIALAYDAPVGAGDATISMYLWDDERGVWYLFGQDTLARGEIHYISLPNVIDRQDSRARNRIDVAIVAGPDGATPAGSYTLTMSSATAQNSSATLAAIIALLTAIEADTTSIDADTTAIAASAASIDADTTAIAASAASIDGTLENPMPVEGATAVGAVPASDPLDLGAVVLDADPAPYTDGDIQRLRLDDVGRLIVTDTSSSEVQGIDADDDPVTVNPIVVGGVYYADPTADTIDDGDVGYALLNELRMLVTEDRAYDAASDANRNIPVWNPTDLWTPEDLSGSATADGTESYYVSLEENSRYSLQFIPSEAASEVITLEIFQSNENDPDITARTYTEVTSTFFGVGGFTAEAWVEIENPTRALSARFDVTVSGYTAGTSEWSLWLVKGGNS